MIVFYRFLDYINRRKIKIKDIIANTGISGATIAKLSNNKSVTIETIDKICDYLQCQPSDLMEFENNKEKQNDK